MDILEFIARSEWPLVAAGTIFLLRRSLVTMVEHVTLTKIDAWGLKAEFEKGLAKVDALTASKNEVGDFNLVTPDLSATVLDESVMPELLEAPSVARSPEAMVLESWQQLEFSIYLRADTKSPRPQRSTGFSTHRSIEQAAHIVGFSEDEISSLKVLHTLRNHVAHANSDYISWHDAVRFSALAEALLGRVARLEKQQEQPDDAKVK